MSQKIYLVILITSFLSSTVKCTSKKTVRLNPIEYKVNNEAALCSNFYFDDLIDSNNILEILDYNLNHSGLNIPFIEILNVDSSEVLSIYYGHDYVWNNINGIKVTRYYPKTPNSARRLHVDDRTFKSGNSLTIGSDQKRLKQALSMYQYGFQHEDSVVYISHFATDTSAISSTYPWSLYIYDSSLVKQFCKPGYFTQYCLFVNDELIEFSYQYAMVINSLGSVYSLKKKGWKSVVGVDSG